MNRRPGTIALLVALVSGTAVGWSIYHLLLTGSCSTPAGPGEVPCPPETWHYVVALIGGVFGGFAAGATTGGSLIFVSVFGGLGVGAVMAGLNDGGESWFVLFGASFLLTPVLLLVGFFVAGLRRVRAARLMAGGVPATGTVLAVRDTGVTINGNPRLRMTFRIVPDDGVTAPFEGTKTATVPRVSNPRVGDSYPVFIDPQDNGKWMVAVAGPAMSEGRLRSAIGLARHGAAPVMPPAP
jgi:hypothetical protein